MYKAEFTLRKRKKPCCTLANKDDHQRGETITAKGVLPFKYKKKTNTEGTSWTGFQVYLDLARAIRVKRINRKTFKGT